MATEIWTNIGSGNGLLHHVITDTDVDQSSVRSCGIYLRPISQVVLDIYTHIYIYILYLEIIQEVRMQSVMNFILASCPKSILSLQWRHVSDNVSKASATRLLVKQRLYDDNKENGNGLHYWPSDGNPPLGNHRGTTFSSRKRPVMPKA